MDYFKHLKKDNCFYCHFGNNLFKIYESVIDVNIDSYIKIFKDVHSYNNYFDLEDLIYDLNSEFEHFYKNIEFVVNYKSSDKNYIEGMYNFLNKKIYIIVSSNFFNEFKNNYKNIENLFKKALSHELIHKEQMKKVSFKYFKNKSYPIDNELKRNLSHNHEIMAYANSIVICLLNKFSQNEALTFLKNPKPNYCKELDTYIDFFKNENNKVIKLLYKYIYQYIIKGNK